MRRIIGIAGAMLIVLLLLVPAVFAASPLPHTGRVLMSFGGDVTLPAGEHADAVIVINGTATILGEANTVVAVDATVNLLGARAESVLAIRSPVEVGQGTVVYGDIRTLESAVHQTGNASVQGKVSDLTADLALIGFVLGPAFFLWFIGLALAGIVAAMLLAGIAARQVRAVETLIRTEPGTTFVVGVGGLIVPLFLAVLAIITIVGAPVGLGLLLGLWPLTAFIGYLVTGIFIGDWILNRVNGEVPAERPYLAAVVGMIVLEVMGIIPPIAALATLFGFGGVILMAWRTWRHRDISETTPQHLPAPSAA